MNMRPSIPLTNAERELFDQIEFDAHARLDHLQWQRNGELAMALAKSLAHSGTIPEHRRRYFIDSDYNVGGRGSSRLDVFYKNGRRGDEVLQHPHFLEYLRYFICGVALPERTITAFRAAVEECGNVTSSDIVPLGKKAHAMAKALGLEPSRARDLFFQLALECGLNVREAASIRDAAGRK